MAEATTEGKGALQLPGRLEQVLLGLCMFFLGVAAIVAPLLAGKNAPALLGVLILASSLLETTRAFTLGDERIGNSVFFSSSVSFLAGLLLLAQPHLILDALVGMLGVSFALDGLVQLATAVWLRGKPGCRASFGQGAMSLVLGGLIAAQWPLSGVGALATYVGLRILTNGWSMLLGRFEGRNQTAEEQAAQHPDLRLHLAPHQEVARLQGRIILEEDTRRWIDRYWLAVFLLTFFAIHIGRMDADWTFVGLLSPAVAVVGDVLFSLLLGYGILMPLRLSWRAVTRPVERRAWNWVLAEPRGRSESIPGQVVQRWLKGRIAFSRRASQVRHSPRAALNWGLEVGLPLTAILVALNPIWGFSWYFNTENWATEIWNNWAEQRTDTWRQHMTQAVQASYASERPVNPDLFQIAPSGVTGATDFSFLILGDPGEGDASQHILRDQYLDLGQEAETKFLVISSDVIYPSGAMKDYEFRFYLPFKGFHKPIYAIPGNHDWYDALEGFGANFLEPRAARAALRARREADHGLTSTTETRIESLLDEAARLQELYGLTVRQQRAPYFEVQTERLALIAVDTGVLRSIDDDQKRWLENALTRSQGKFKLVVLGHPFYAGGRYQGAADPGFRALHELLRQHQVDVAMAGDTHYFEFYREHYETDGQPRTMLHFVNGGGGAYLSIGTPLDWPTQPALPEYAFYPRRDAIIAKLDRETPQWKQPLWFWLKRFHAWPSSSEAFASAFDFNRAPFFQSFVKVQVRGSANLVQIWPYGSTGRLRWRDLDLGQISLPEKATLDDYVDLPLPLKTALK